jgi:hypothetical protein
LQAALDAIPYGEPVVAAVGTCLRAIPDLLAVVRAAQAFLGDGPTVEWPEWDNRAALRSALDAFEEGGKP